MKIKVYIASPYTLGDVAVNVKNQIDTANELLELGYLPYTPLMCHFHHMIHPQPYDTWAMFSMEWLKICDAVLRLAGESKGAAAEVYTAQQLGIPVFTSLVELNKHFKVYKKGGEINELWNGLRKFKEWAQGMPRRLEW